MVLVDVIKHGFNNTLVGGEMSSHTNARPRGYRIVRTGGCRPETLTKALRLLAEALAEQARRDGPREGTASSSVLDMCQGSSAAEGK